MAGKIYVVKNGGVAISTAITVIQIKAGAGNPLELLRVVISQGLSETSTQEQVQILRKTVAATVTSSTPLLLDPDAEVSGAVGGVAATGITASAEGTDGDVLVDDGFNILNGWVWLPTPKEQIKVPAAGIIALKFPVAPTSATWRAAIYYEEF